jgi:hypothetical protein
MPQHQSLRKRAAAIAVAAIVTTAGLVLPASPSFATVAAPTITGLSVTKGSTAGGTALVITGTGLSTVTAVTFGGTNATSFALVSDSQLQAVAPAGTGAADTGIVNVLVTNPGGTSGATVKSQYAYREPITVSGVAAGTLLNPIAGSVLTLTSSYTFSGSAGYTKEKITVTVGGVAAVATYVDTTHIKITVPAGTPSNTPAPIAMLHDGITGTPSSNAKYAAVISALSRHVGPTAGEGGTITVTGKGFTNATGWKFGTQPATCSVVSDTSASCTSIPALSTPGVGGVAVNFTPDASAPFGYTASGSYVYTNLG